MDIIKNIRQKLIEEGMDAYVITYGNRCIGQDVLPDEHKLKKLCGFSGSAGIAAVTNDAVYLLVDGRYELQARLETDADTITVIDMMPRLKNICDILIEKNCKTIGYDAWCHTIAEMEFIKRRYHDISFIDAGYWFDDCKSSNVEICERDNLYTGKSSRDKIEEVISQLKEKKANYYLFTSADSVSWLLNIYTHDLPFSPVVRAYALLDVYGNVTLYSDGLQTTLTHGNWHDFEHKLASLGECNMLYDAHLTPEKVKYLVNQDTKLIKSADLCQTLKTVKNNVELKGMIDCHVRDGVALSKFLCWFDHNWKDKTELDVVGKVHEFREQQQHFFSESFSTIAAYGSNGAVVHYKPSEQHNQLIEEGSLLLLDSGAQYLDGTTDVTRTIVIGRPSKEMISDFTVVLKAHIALAKSCFPENTPGEKLDIISRMELWKYGLDYKHGTGHGVACFGNVHEMPLSISSGGSDYGLKAGMVTSDEPGIYRAGFYGIRIENLLYTSASEYDGFIKFIPLTKVPIDKRLIDKYMLDEGEQAWLNNYHQNVYDCLAPYMNEIEKKWLKDACSPL